MGWGPIGDIIAGVYAPAALGYMQQQEANQRNDEQARRQMGFQQYNADTVHQREVADLKAAGLNPILSGTGGSGAPAPQGASATMNPPQINMPDFLSYGVSLRQLEQQQQKIDIDAKLADASIAKNLTDQQYTKMQTELSKRGMPRAVIEGEASELLRKGLRYLRNQVQKPRLPTHGPDSSGAEMSQP